MSTSATAISTSPADQLEWMELLHRLAEGAWKVNQAEYKELGLNNAREILFPPASEEAIAVAEEKVGTLPEDFKEMVRVANGFRGGWHFLSGGIAGIDGIAISEEKMDDFEAEFENTGDFFPNGEMIELKSSVECDGFRHFIITPKVWKANVRGREVGEVEHRYWNFAPWQACAKHCGSVKYWVVRCVVELEKILERRA